MIDRTRFVKLTVNRSPEHSVDGDTWFAISSIETMCAEGDGTLLETSSGRYFVCETVAEVLSLIAEAEGGGIIPSSIREDCADAICAMRTIRFDDSNRTASCLRVAKWLERVA